jgi:hypothetical protein
MGYGDLEALELLHQRANRQYFALRHQPGLRLGVLIADDAVLVYSPTPRLIEAGSKTPDKPNAIVLDAGVSAAIESAAGSETSEVLPPDAELGRAAVTDAMLETTRADLKAAPPQRFDVARQAKVVSSRIGYVELEIKGVHLAQRRLKLPANLLHADADEALLGQLTSDIKPMAIGDEFEVMLFLDDDGRPVLDDKGKPVSAASSNRIPEAYTPKRLANEAKMLRDRYLTVLPNYGTVIYNAQRTAFEKEAGAYKARLQAYLGSLSETVKSKASEQADKITDLVMRRLDGKPPRGALPKDFPGGYTNASVRAHIRDKVLGAFEQTFNLEGQVHWRYKAIAPESVSDDETFIDAVKSHFPEHEFARLFEQFDAARGETGKHSRGKNA